MHTSLNQFDQKLSYSIVLISLTTASSAAEYKRCLTIMDDELEKTQTKTKTTHNSYCLSSRSLGDPVSPYCAARRVTVQCCFDDSSDDYCAFLEMIWPLRHVDLSIFASLIHVHIDGFAGVWEWNVENPRNFGTKKSPRFQTWRGRVSPRFRI